MKGERRRRREKGILKYAFGKHGLKKQSVKIQNYDRFFLNDAICKNVMFEYPNNKILTKEFQKK